MSFALEISWDPSASEDLPNLVGPFKTQEEADEWAGKNVPNGTAVSRPLTFPYYQRRKSPDPTDAERRARADRIVHGLGEDHHGPYEVVRYGIPSKFFIEHADRRRQVSVRGAAQAASRGFVGRDGGTAFDREWLQLAGLA